MKLRRRFHRAAKLPSGLRCTVLQEVNALRAVKNGRIVLNGSVATYAWTREELGEGTGGRGPEGLLVLHGWRAVVMCYAPFSN